MKFQFSIICMMAVVALVGLALWFRTIVLPPTIPPNINRIMTHFEACDSCKKWESKTTNNFSMDLACKEMAAIWEEETTHGNWIWNSEGLAYLEKVPIWVKSRKFDSAKPAYSWVWRKWTQ